MLVFHGSLFAAELLQTLRIDYLKEKDGAQHHTDKYIHKDLGVRRADSFLLDLYFKNRKYRAAKDHIFLEFAIGKSASVRSFRLLLLFSKNLQSWKDIIYVLCIERRISGYASSNSKTNRGVLIDIQLFPCQD